MKEQSKYNEPCQDHLGKNYANYREMAEAYGLTRHQLLSRIYSGMSLEEALTKPIGRGRLQPCTDHRGKEYHSYQAMAKAYGLTYVMLQKRLNQYGWDLQRALTTPAEDEPSEKSIRCRDHLGNKYPSLSAMAEAYGLTYDLLQQRLDRGWDLERALTAPIHSRPAFYADHKGNQYSRLQDLADAYGMSSTTLRNRLKEGWDLEKALTSPLKGRWGYSKKE